MKEAMKLADRLNVHYWHSAVTLAELLATQRQVDREEIEVILEPGLLPTW